MLNSETVGEIHVNQAAPNISSFPNSSAVLMLNNIYMSKNRIDTLMVLLHVSGVLCSATARFHLPYFSLVSTFMILYV